MIYVVVSLCVIGSFYFGAFMMWRKKEQEMKLLRIQAAARAVVEEAGDDILIHYRDTVHAIPAQVFMDALLNQKVRLFGMTLQEINDLRRWKQEHDISCEEHKYDPKPMACPECRAKKK
ncbi:MAG: hypothetical protein AB7C95_00845 [Synergistaceae bacterium]